MAASQQRDVTSDARTFDFIELGGAVRRGVALNDGVTQPVRELANMADHAGNTCATSQNCMYTRTVRIGLSSASSTCRQQELTYVWTALKLCVGFSELI